MTVKKPPHGVAFCAGTGVCQRWKEALRRQEPLTGTNCTSPALAPFNVSCPLAVTATVTVALAEEAAPRSKATLRDVG